jgi:flagellar protein FliO/FliZ
MTGDMIFRMIAALLLVLGLMGIFAVALRKWGHKLGLAMVQPVAGGKKRIQLQDVAMLDARHRLVIVRCDDVDYKIILGGSHPVVLPDERT